MNSNRNKRMRSAAVIVCKKTGCMNSNLNKRMRSAAAIGCKETGCMNSNLNKRILSAAVIRCKETEQYRHQRVQTEKIPGRKKEGDTK